MVEIKFVIFFICIWVGGVNAQRVYRTDTIAFSGIIINTETNLPLPDVTCRLGRVGTVSNKAGQFAMRAGRGDSVQFSHVGFAPYTIVVPDSLVEPEYILGIFMSPDTIVLAEVIIIRRFGESQRQKMMYARNNMSGVLKQAYAPVKGMDAAMNQQMMINKYARSVEMRGHVDVGLGIGTQSLDAYKKLQLQKKKTGEQVWLENKEIDLLIYIYNTEKRKNQNN